VQDTTKEDEIERFMRELERGKWATIFWHGFQGILGTFPKGEILFRRGWYLLLNTSRIVGIHTRCTTTSLGTEIKASLGIVFEEDFGEFSVGCQSYKSEGTTWFCGNKY
jgi:hypothetical protein